MKKIILSLCIGISFPAFAQKAKLKYADKLFANWEYFEAAEVYTEVANQQKKKKVESGDVMAKTARAHYLSGNIVQSDFWYTQALQAKMLNDADALEYFKVLLMQAKYEDAQFLAKQFPGIIKAHPIGQAFINNDPYLKLLLEDDASYEISEMPINSGTADFSPIWVGKDLYFVSARKSYGAPSARFAANNQHYLKLMHGQKNKKGDWTVKMLKKPFTHAFHDGPLFMSSDAKTAYLTTNNWKKKNKNKQRVLEVYEFKKTDKSWSKPVTFSFNSSEYNVGHIAISPDGNTMVFVSDMSGGKGGTDLYMATKNGNSWTNIFNLSALNTEGNEMFPSFDQRGTLYFSSDGKLGLGGLDIYYAQSENGVFSRSANMGARLNSSADDFAITFGESGNEAWFSSNRNGYVDRIYHTSIAPFLVPFSGIVTDAISGKPLENATVIIENKNLGIRTELITDINGFYSTKLAQADGYTLHSEKDRFLAQDFTLPSLTGYYRGDVEKKDIALMPAKNMAQIMLKDEKTGMPITNAPVRIIVAGNKDMLKTSTDDKGSVFVEFKPGSDAMIWASKKGYFDNTIAMKLPKNDSAQVKRIVTLTPFEKDLKLEIENIFYDYAKFTLRKESEVELDKVAEFLNDNDNIKVELGSHSDSRGNDKSNMTLSQKRAESCVKYLLSKGVNPENIIAKGYGESQPVNRCVNGVKCSEAEYQENRRTELKILEIK